MPESKDILVGFDGRAGGVAALTEAIKMARTIGGRLVVVFAYEPPARAGGEVADLRETLRQMGTKIETEAKALLDSSGVDYELVLADARPAPGLAQLAEAHDARMIVVGGAGEAPLTGALLGAVPHKLLQLTDRPVLVVRSVEDEE